MSGDIRAAWEHLRIEADEVVVLSVVYETATSTPTLMAGSLLVGPPAIAEGGWPAWRLAEGFKPAPGEEALKVPATFTVEFDGAVAGRTSLDQGDAYAWLRSALEQGVCPAVGPLPQAHASLGAARSPIRVCTHSQTDAGDLAHLARAPNRRLPFSPNRRAGRPRGRKIMDGRRVRAIHPCDRPARDVVV